MKFLVLSLSIALWSVSSAAKVKVIYGEDNRLDVFEETNSLYIDLARSTAAMVPNENLSRLNDYETELGGTTLSERGICEDERFAQQPTVANCSGFLVGENKLVTAGHCIRSVSDCKNNSWVFDYRVDYSDQSAVVVENSKIYKCKRIIAQDLNNSNKNDYALIELEEVVQDREPLKFRTSGAPAKGDRIVVIGHPTGLPTKIAAGAAVRSVNGVYFTANLDTYGGNSGSAVFNAETGVVEGILVRGETDYVWDSSKKCRASNVLSNTGGRGEDVTLITNIKELMTQNNDDQSGDNGDVDNGSGDDGNGDNGNDDEDPYADLPDWLRWLLGL